jgi:hypothetical protein
MARPQCSLRSLTAGALALALAGGCASLPRTDVRAAAPKVSTDGYYTVAGGRPLNLARTREFYEEAGADEALDHLNRGIRLYRHGKTAVLRDMAIGAAIGGLAGLANDAATGQNRQDYSHNEFGGWTLGGALLGVAVSVPFGLGHSSHLKRAALPEIQAAARAYNLALDEGRLSRGGAARAWDALPPGLEESDRPAARTLRPKNIWCEGLVTVIGEDVLELDALPAWYRDHGAEASARAAEEAQALMRINHRKGVGAVVLGTLTGALAGYLVAAGQSGDDANQAGDRFRQAIGVGAFGGAALAGVGHAVGGQDRRNAAEARVELAAELYRRRLAGR